MQRLARFSCAAAAAVGISAASLRPGCSVAGTNDYVCFEGRVREAGIDAIEAVPGGLLLTNATQSIRLNLGSRQLESGGATVWLHAAPVIPYNATSGWQVVKEDLESVLLPIIAPTNGATAKLRVVLDAGHGGEDGGASSYDGGLIQEKSFTLDMVRRIGALLGEAGMEVAYTREDDITLQLRERTDFAASTNADIFVSIHANNASNPSAAGFETYVLPCAGHLATGASTISPKKRDGNDNDFLNNLLAFQGHRRLPGRKRGYDRGVRRARYQVLRDAKCPAILIECGFLSNAGDVKRLSSNWYRDLFAKAVAEGIIDYASRVPPKSSEEPEKTSPPSDVAQPPDAALQSLDVAAQPNDLAQQPDEELRPIDAQPVDDELRSDDVAQPDEAQKPDAIETSDAASMLDPSQPTEDQGL